MVCVKQSALYNTKPIVSAKIRRISQEIRTALAAEEKPSPAYRVAMLRFRAMLVLNAHSLNRGAELGTTLTYGVVRFPDNSGLLFNYTWGDLCDQATLESSAFRASHTTPTCALSRASTRTWRAPKPSTSS